MDKMPSKYKLTGDAKRLWEILTDEYGSVLKERHKPLLFAMCQQWELYQKAHAKLKRNKESKQEWTLHCQMSGSLKQFKSIAKEFAMGINDQLEFNLLPGIGEPGKPQTPKSQSRLEQLLNGGSLN